MNFIIFIENKKKEIILSTLLPVSFDSNTFAKKKKKSIGQFFVWDSNKTFKRLNRFKKGFF